MTSERMPPFAFDDEAPRPCAAMDHSGPAARDFYIVGIGASAGGLEALERVFNHIPADTGMAFVIVQHLSPDFKSVMDELLARHTQMPIRRAEDGMVVEPNAIYLMPAKKEMIISGGRLHLTDKDPSQALTLPIDHFFRSLAQDIGSRSVAVVLSGSGSDGSRGIRDIHEAGGLVVAQSAESAKFDSMPRTAMETGVVDIAVDPEELGNVLLRYARRSVGAQWKDGEGADVDETAQARVFRLLQQRHNVDFNHYKPGTIGRRIERRIQLNHNHNGSLEDYVRRLESDPAEVDHLYRDLLIGVTHFFRNPEAFEALGNDVLPKLLEKAPADEEFRVWVAGCATGEEAYSLAILLHEQLEKMARPPSVKIFATDLHRVSLEKASSGIYSEAELGNISHQRRERYFQRLNNGYQVRSEIRRMIVFAPHNLTRDAPFTRMQLITCRNLLIYLRPHAQKKILSLFHFGLNAGGILFLGSSETPGDLSDEFDTVEERWRLYRKRRDVRLPAESWAPLASRPPKRPAARGGASGGQALGGTEREMLGLYDELLAQYMPPAVLVNSRWEVLQTFGGAGKLLQFTDGRLTVHLLELVQGDLKLALVGALQRVTKTGEPVAYSRVRVALDGEPKQLRLGVAPLRAGGADVRYLVSFEQEEPAPSAAAAEVATFDVDQVTHDRVQDLEQELSYTKENLQATIEELETANEELQASNEELVASNEELQSTNEELHSVNEELYSVNAEYQWKIRELTELTNDMDNLLASTEVHTLFLDRNLCVRKFTPKLAEAFNLLPQDVGRRIDAFAHNIACQGLNAKLRRVLESGEVHEETVEGQRGNRFLMRLLPYAAGDRHDGVVLTLIDISSLVEAQQQVRHANDRFERAISAAKEGIWDWPDVNSDQMWWSPNCYRLLGYEPGEVPATYSQWLRLIHPDDLPRVRDTRLPTQQECFVDVHRDFEYRLLHKSGAYRWYQHRTIVDHDQQGNAVRMTGSLGDIQKRKLAEQRAQEEIDRRDRFLAMLSHELRNPMGAVLTALDLMGAAGTDPEVSDEGLRVIDRQVRHMARLLDDLLDVSRISQNKITYKREVVDLDHTVEEVVQTIEHLIDARNQRLSIEVNDAPLRVWGDAARLRQVQLNLLTNASKYTPVGGRIALEMCREDDEVVVRVRDSGEGIAPDVLGSIFDVFVQSDESLDRARGGMGLGLAITKSIVQAHRGRIIAHSEGPGRGSEFTVRLPLTDRPPRQSEAAPAVPTFAGRRLVLAEDNDDARRMLAKLLQQSGFEVLEAANGAEALEHFRQSKIDVAVLDLGLPEVDGFEVARTVRRSSGPSAPLLVALTGYGRESDLRATAEAGFDVHLTKPLDPDELFALLGERLGESVEV